MVFLIFCRVVHLPGNKSICILIYGPHNPLNIKLYAVPGITWNITTRNNCLLSTLLRNCRQGVFRGIKGVTPLFPEFKEKKMRKGGEKNGKRGEREVGNIWKFAKVFPNFCISITWWGRVKKFCEEKFRCPAPNPDLISKTPLNVRNLVKGQSQHARARNELRYLILYIPWWLCIYALKLHSAYIVKPGNIYQTNLNRLGWFIWNWIWK